ncbi:hypothetical protein ACTHSJ_33760 [Paenibacillus cellulositrophicus]|uniref:hypothetical protein n=1 Tax=Paenibacillus cellulositrophicus TaxID=562959 RepID=UPI003F817A13
MYKFQVIWYANNDRISEFGANTVEEGVSIAHQHISAQTKYPIQNITESEYVEILEKLINDPTKSWSVDKKWIVRIVPEIILSSNE